MRELVFEYLNYITAVTAGSVSIAVGVLFFIANRRHKTLHTRLRSIAFFLIGESFGFHLFVRAYPDLAPLAFTFELVGLIVLYYALLINRDIGQVFYSEIVFENRPKPLKKLPELLRFLLSLIIICICFVFVINQATGSTQLGLITLVFACTIACFAIIYEKFKRLISSSKEQFNRNLIVLIAFILLQFRLMLSVGYFAPSDLGIINYNEIVNPNGAHWLSITLVTLAAFILISIWQWSFIQKRFFIRLIEVILGINIFISVASSLVILLFGSSILQGANFNLVKDHGVLITNIIKGDIDNLNNVSEFIASENDLKEHLLSPQEKTLRDLIIELESFRDDVDYIILNSIEGNVITSIGTIDSGYTVSSELLKKVISTKTKYLILEDLSSGVSTVKAINPVTIDEVVKAVLVVGFNIDSSYLQSIKSNSSIDLVFFLGRKPITSTFNESISQSNFEAEVINKVFGENKAHSAIVNINKKEFYANFITLNTSTGFKDGVLMSLKEKRIINEDTRKELVLSFVVITNIAFILTFVGYSVLKKGYQSDVAEETKTT